jgi:hypothetical protein
MTRWVTIKGESPRVIVMGASRPGNTKSYIMVRLQVRRLA